MGIGWADIAFQLGEPLAEEVMTAWSWLFPERWTPLVCSMVGGVFLETESGSIHWLDTGTGLLEQVANDKAQFEEIMRSSPQQVEEWFLPGLVERLHDAGKRAGAGQCYGFTFLPVFAEGKYDTENMFVAPVREQFVGIADVHRQISDLPDGSAVRLKVID